MAGEFSSLQDLYRAAPTVAAFMTGQQRAQEMEASQLANQAKVQANQRDAQMMPLDVMFRQGQVDTQAAQLPGVQADSTIKGVNARVAQAGEQDTIAKNASAAKLQMSEDQVKQMQQYGQVAGLLGTELESVAPVQRTAFLRQQLSRIGVDENSPIVQGLMRTPPEQLPKALQDLNKKLALTAQTHLQKMEEERLKGDKARDVANIYANAKTTAAGIASRGKLPDEQVQFDKLPNAKAKHAMAVAKAQQYSETDPQRAGYWSGIADALRPQAESEIASQKPGTPQLPGIPTAGSPQIAPPGAKPQQAPAPNQDIVKAVQAAGQQYEPDKYEYRIGPNGNVQRKPK